MKYIKILSILCIFSAFCIFLSSCANPFDSYLANPTGISMGDSADTTTVISTQTAIATETTTPDEQTTETPATTSPEAAQSLPDEEKPNIVYLPYITKGPLDDVIPPSIEDVFHLLSFLEKEGRACAVCAVTLANIDYTQITDQYEKIPIVLTIDKIFEKNSAFPINEGDIVSAIDYNSKWIISSENSFTVRYSDLYFPIAEVGRQYIVTLYEGYSGAGSAEDSAYTMDGISAPLPSGNEMSDEYFEEQFQRFAIDTTCFAREVLEKWFYPYIESE